MLDELYIYQRREILKVIQNLDLIYGADSVEKTNGLNKLQEHLMLNVTVS